MAFASFQSHFKGEKDFQLLFDQMEEAKKEYNLAVERLEHAGDRYREIASAQVMICRDRLNSLIQEIKENYTEEAYWSMFREPEKNKWERFIHQLHNLLIYGHWDRLLDGPY
ncbi:hypothetical protein H1S01_05800 [Heliobacterium chlorum]|uniref:Uncharacterized protein n=1 Tax=Heliobacterium chlorum TaxID=2698 RepID=A0ABR7SZR4_HELCL|nr:hypothetical protein [Heliobacterium chlorum]MBC9784025.1 hypothetical protein [Heliobacterium chlorum]